MNKQEALEAIHNLSLWGGDNTIGPKEKTITNAICIIDYCIHYNVDLPNDIGCHAVNGNLVFDWYLRFIKIEISCSSHIDILFMGPYFQSICPFTSLFNKEIDATIGPLLCHVITNGNNAIDRECDICNSIITRFTGRECSQCDRKVCLNCAFMQWWYNHL